MMMMSTMTMTTTTMIRRRLRPALAATTSPLLFSSNNRWEGDSISTTRKVDFPTFHHHSIMEEDRLGMNNNKSLIRNYYNLVSPTRIQLPHHSHKFFQRPSLIIAPSSYYSKIQQQSGDRFHLDDPFRSSFVLTINATTKTKAPIMMDYPPAPHLPNNNTHHLFECYYYYSMMRFPTTKLTTALTSTTITTRPSTMTPGQRRYFSSAKKGDDSDNNKETTTGGDDIDRLKKDNKVVGNSATTEAKDGTTDNKVSSSFISLPNAPARTTAELAKIRQNFANYEETIKRVVSRQDGSWNTSDLLSVYGIVALIVLIGTAPFVVRHMQKSDSTYEDIDPEDPVTDLAAMIRGEYFGPAAADDDAESSGRSALGLDRIVADLMKSPQVGEAATQLVVKVVQSQQFKRACQALLKELWTDLVSDEETLRQVIHLLQNAIQDPKIKDAAVELVMEVFGDDQVLDELVVLVQRLGVEKQVQDATQALLVESAHNALNDPEILDHSMEFATDVVGDDVVQQTAGEALYNTLTYAVRPTLSVILSLLGLGLISVSILAFRNAHRAPNEAPIADEAIIRAIETQGSRLYKIMNFPIDFLIACKDAIASVLLFPFRFVSKGLSRFSKVGESLAGAIQRWFEWFLGLPKQLWSSISISLGSISKSALTAVQMHHDALVDWLRRSSLGVQLSTIFNDISNAVVRSSSSLLNVAGRFRVQWIVLNVKLATAAIAAENYGRKLMETVTSALAVENYYGKFVEMYGDDISRLALTTETHSKKLLLRLSRDCKTLNRKLTDWAMQVELYIANLSNTIRSRF